jgi:cytochrome P450
MPFSAPVTTAAGEEITSLLVRKGTVITSPISYVNRAEEFWGPNAKEFEPERWLAMDSFGRAKEIQGYKHILTFSDGPRICLGKSLALAEFKVSYRLYIWLCLQ